MSERYHTCQDFGILKSKNMISISRYTLSPLSLLLVYLQFITKGNFGNKSSINLRPRTLLVVLSVNSSLCHEKYIRRGKEVGS